MTYDRWARRAASAAIVFFLIVLHLNVPLRAQGAPQEPDPDSVRVRLGPLWLNPGLALTNAGVDTNVFYEPESLQPERDFTITVTALSDYWLRMGRTWIAGQVKEDLVWFQTFAQERSANQSYSAYWLVPLNRLRMSAGANWINTRERPGFEIDARSRRQELAGSGTLELRALSKTFVGARVDRRVVNFDETAQFLGANLQQELNRTVSAQAVTVRHELTPLTSVSVEAVKGQDRFEFSPVRDSDSSRINTSITFAPYALISGSAQFGYREFQPRDKEVPGYTGSTISVNLSHVVRGSTRLGLQVLRDIQYSFEINEPYFLQTGFTVSAAQQIFGPIDVEGRGGASALAYRARGGTEDPTRTDHVRSVGGGVGYRLGQNLRIGFNVDHQKRTSDIVRLTYDGYRYGMAVGYGL